MYKKVAVYSPPHRIYTTLKTLVLALLLTAFRGSMDTHLPFQPLAHTPQRIALLLPFKGEWKTISDAIQKGFIAANESNKTSLLMKTIDTSQDHTLQKSYQRAEQWGADLIIGPLLKSEVKAFAQLRALKAPILTLNYLNKEENAPANFYQFGLSPLDEAHAITEHAKSQQHQSALILVPDNDWGKELAEHFTKSWKQLGGQVAGTLKYSNTVSLLNRQLRKFLDFSPPKQRRDDFDVIFLAATSEIGRQINPLLAFYFASNVPIYANAAIYDPKISSHLNRDLDDIMIADTPWSIGIKTIHPTIRARCLSKSQKHFDTYARYYALGADAFLLAMNLVSLDQDAQQKIQGASGELSLDIDRYVIRKPLFAQLKYSTPKPLEPC